MAPADIPPLPQFHLTARPWASSTLSRTDYLQRLEALCRFWAKHQNPEGAIIDPFLQREHQYATPYFAFAVAVLLRGKSAPDLKRAGLLAMDHATKCFAGGSHAIPDRHGEFFTVALAEALELYRNVATPEQWGLWRQRLRVPRNVVMQGPSNNWRTYAMRGEWLRAKLGLVNRESAQAFIEESWQRGGQRDRMTRSEWNLYEDRETDPESHAVEAVGRGNLLGLLAAGYDGESCHDMRAQVERGTDVSLLLQDPSGQCPPNGRADNHVWNDVLYQLAFDIRAEELRRSGALWKAGQYRRAAALAFRSSGRWLRSDGAWSGSCYVTKNRMDPQQRVGYQAASNYANYNLAMAFHLAEAWLQHSSDIREKPAPCEIGGFALETGPDFSSVVANAGGMQLFAALRGDTKKVYGNYWTPLGVLRLGRVNWETRLGPSDGVRDAATGEGLSFAPTWLEHGRWVRLASVPERYRGEFHVTFTHPVLVRCRIDYKPINGTGPIFHHEFTLTPDGILAVLTAEGTDHFGATWPLLENDGQPLRTRITSRYASTTYREDCDEQVFLNIEGKNIQAEETLLSSYGSLRAVRVEALQGKQVTWIYPRSQSDPSAEALGQSFALTRDGFVSALGRVSGSVYSGRTSAGGDASALDEDGDGRPEVSLSESCRFIVQKNNGSITALETDRPVTALVRGKKIQLHAFKPYSLDQPIPLNAVDVTDRAVKVIW